MDVMDVIKIVESLARSDLLTDYAIGTVKQAIKKQKLDYLVL